MGKTRMMNKAKTVGRRLFLVDIENAVGRAVLDERIIEDVRIRLSKDYGIKVDEMVVIGTSHSMNMFTASIWKGARQVFGRGVDGADRALLKVMVEEGVGERFDEVVLVSGDGIFADAVRALRADGVKVIVDSRAKSLSYRLIACASVFNLVAPQPAPDNFGRAA